MKTPGLAVRHCRQDAHFRGSGVSHVRACVSTRECRDCHHLQLVLMYTGGFPRAPPHQMGTGAHTDKWLDGFLPSKKRKNRTPAAFPSLGLSRAALFTGEASWKQDAPLTALSEPRGSQSPSVNCEHWVGSLLGEEGRTLEGEGCLRGHESSSP